MPTSPKPQRREHPSTYFVQDRQSEEELIRLKIQDSMITTAMGGPLAGLDNAADLRRVLDIGCGPGGWIIEAARIYPELFLTGIDISQRMISYARKQAIAQQVADRVEFHIMDALRMLEFPDDFFDGVNLRLGVSYLRTWDWPRVLNEMLRVTRPGGTVQVTDQEIIHERKGPTSNPALTQLNAMFLCALFRSGHLFKQESTGLIAHLPGLLKQHGFKNVQTKFSTIDYRAGTPEWEPYYNDTLHLFKTARPFLQKWGCISEGYDSLYQQASVEMRRLNYHSAWKFLTTWGIKGS